MYNNQFNLRTLIRFRAVSLLHCSLLCPKKYSPDMLRINVNGVTCHMIYINNLSEKPDFKIFYVLSTVKLAHKEHTWGLKNVRYVQMSPLW